jgi:alkyl hydroperoxide reductase subunit F
MDFGSFSLDAASLEPPERPDPAIVYDMLILGGGPAAISAAIYAARKMLRIAMISMELGGQVGSTSEIENYAGFQSVSGQDLVSRFVEHMRNFKVPAALGDRIALVKKDGGTFKVKLEGGGEYSGKTVLYALGKAHRKLDVPGENELAGRGVAYCSICDAPFFKGKRVVVAGGGNSAFTSALDLLKAGAEIAMVNYTEGWQADPVLVQAVERTGTVKRLDMHQVTAISGTELVTGVKIRDRRTGNESGIPADGVFVEIGMTPNTAPIKGLAKLSPSGELEVDSHCRTSVEGLFGAGDATTVPYNQIVISAGEGAKAALSAYDYLVSKGLV